MKRMYCWAMSQFQHLKPRSTHRYSSVISANTFVGFQRFTSNHRCHINECWELWYLVMGHCQVFYSDCPIICLRWQSPWPLRFIWQTVRPHQFSNEGLSRVYAKFAVTQRLSTLETLSINLYANFRNRILPHSSSSHTHTQNKIWEVGSCLT